MYGCCNQNPRLIPAVGKAHTYHPSIPLIAHKKMTNVTTPVPHNEVRKTVIYNTIDRIHHKPRSLNSYDPMEDFLNERSITSFEDVSRSIRANTAALLKKVHTPIPRTIRPLSISNEYNHIETPISERISSDEYIWHLLRPLPGRQHNGIDVGYYPETSTHVPLGKTHLACLSYAGSHPISKRRHLVLGPEDDYRNVRHDVELLSHYNRMRKAASVPRDGKLNAGTSNGDVGSFKSYTAHTPYTPEKVLTNGAVNHREEDKEDHIGTPPTKKSALKKKPSVDEEKLVKEREAEKEAEQHRQEEETRKAERLAQEEERKAEARRKAEEERYAEQERLRKQHEEEERKAEARRKAEEERYAEQERLRKQHEEEERKAEARRKAEEERYAEQERLKAEEEKEKLEADDEEAEFERLTTDRQSEEQRLLEEKLIEEYHREQERIAAEEREREQKYAEEQQRVTQDRLAEEQKLLHDKLLKIQQEQQQEETNDKVDEEENSWVPQEYTRCNNIPKRAIYEPVDVVSEDSMAIAGHLKNDDGSQITEERYEKKVTRKSTISVTKNLEDSDDDANSEISENDDAGVEFEELLEDDAGKGKDTTANDDAGADFEELLQNDDVKTKGKSQSESEEEEEEEESEEE